jgi:disulfide bond formation protein DsbB
MNTKPIYLLMLYFAALGALLSGYLSFYTLFRAEGCGNALLTCGDDPVQILGVSQCIWGFFMFLAVGVVAALGAFAGKARQMRMPGIILGTIGTLFAGGLSAYELWFRSPPPYTMPSCVYGFFLFLGVVIAAVLVQRQKAGEQSAPPEER